MILQIGLSNQVQTILTLAAATGSGAINDYNSVRDLKRCYRSFLQSLGQRQIDLSGEMPSLSTDTTSSEKLRNHFCNSSVLDDKNQAIVISEHRDPECIEKEVRLTAALQEVAHYSPTHAAIFDTIITDIFVLPSNIARSGSTSQAIGVIWANPKTTYTTADIVEILIHELTHHSMFLDELRYSHYSYVHILDRGTWAQSAILKIARPLDKVMHSIVVGLEVLLFREKYLGHPPRPRVHPPTPILLDQLRSSISSIEHSLRANTAVLRKRAIELLEHAKRILAETFPQGHEQIPYGYTINTP